MRVAAAGIAFMVIYPFVSLLALFSVIGTEAMALNKNAFVSYGGSWAVLYFVAGVLVFGIAGFRDVNLGLGVLSFATGGLVGGLTIATMLETGVLGSRVTVAIAFAIPFILPWIIAVGMCLLLGLYRVSNSLEQNRTDDTNTTY